MSAIDLNDIQVQNELHAGDLGYVAYLHGLIYREECGYGLPFEAYVLAGLAEFAGQYQGGRDAVWVCRHEQRMVGFLAAVNQGDSIQLRYFLLQKEYRGIGLGKMLMQLFMEHLQRSGLKKAYLWTTDEQRVAINLYTGFGFTLKKARPSGKFGKGVTEQYYELSITTQTI